MGVAKISDWEMESVWLYGKGIAKGWILEKGSQSERGPFGGRGSFGQFSRPEFYLCSGG